MGTGLFPKRALSALAAVLLLIVFAGGSTASSSFRELDRIFEKEGISASDRAQIDRSYGAVLKAGGEKRETLSLIESCLEGGFGGGQIARVLTLLAQLELSELPVESYSSKIQEGVAKRVPVPKILAAAERRALMLKKAENILHSLLLGGYDISDGDDLLPVAAEAMESGKGEAEVRRIIAESLKEGKSTRELKRELLR